MLTFVKYHGLKAVIACAPEFLRCLELVVFHFGIIIQMRNKNGKQWWLIDWVIFPFGTSLTSIAGFTKAYRTSAKSQGKTCR